MIIAVCDSAHGELPADKRRLYWSIPGPVRTGRADDFDRALDELTVRIEQVTSPWTPTSNRASDVTPTNATQR